ncbi:MAG: hypothetical protein DSY35_01390 [Desulfurobacterium sp.]|nr:MAG: hypothetical protein DSY35_01390 [Desulfurobacterium sp.]
MCEEKGKLFGVKFEPVKDVRTLRRDRIRTFSSLVKNCDCIFYVSGLGRKRLVLVEVKSKDFLLREGVNLSENVKKLLRKYIQSIGVIVLTEEEIDVTNADIRLTLFIPCYLAPDERIQINEIIRKYSYKFLESFVRASHNKIWVEDFYFYRGDVYKPHVVTYAVGVR